MGVTHKYEFEFQKSILDLCKNKQTKEQSHLKAPLAAVPELLIQSHDLLQQVFPVMARLNSETKFFS